MSTMKTADLINMKCESKAVRRALRLATGIGSGFTTEEEAEDDEAQRGAFKGIEAQRRFWARATELYPAPPGTRYRVDKAKVHEALGIGPEDGALRDSIDCLKEETGLTEEGAWDIMLNRLEDVAHGFADEGQPEEGLAEEASEQGKGEGEESE
jgi:hypothetical protein